MEHYTKASTHRPRSVGIDVRVDQSCRRAHEVEAATPQVKGDHVTFQRDNGKRYTVQSDAELTKAAAAMKKRGAKGKPGEGKKPRKERKGKKGKKSQE